MLPDVMLWRGAEPLTALAPDDRSLRYGDGLFESVRVLAGRPVLMAEHWARLSSGCERLALPDEPIWREYVQAFLQGRGTGVMRVQVSAGSGGRGYGRPTPCEPVLILTWHDEPMPPAAWSSQGICMAELSLTLSDQPMLAGIKHCNRLEQVLMRAELATLPGCQEAVVYDHAGRVIEGVFSNLFFVRDGELHTPALARCGVRGVLRDALLNACAERDISVHIDDYTRADLLAAEAIFFVNSVNGLWPIQHWQGQLPSRPLVSVDATKPNKTWRIDAITRQCQDIIAPWFASA